MNYDQKGFVEHILEVIEIQNKKEFSISRGNFILLKCHLTDEVLAFDKKTYKHIP